MPLPTRLTELGKTFGSEDDEGDDEDDHDFEWSDIWHARTNEGGPETDQLEIVAA